MSDLLSGRVSVFQCFGVWMMIFFLCSIIFNVFIYVFRVSVTVKRKQRDCVVKRKRPEESPEAPTTVFSRRRDENTFFYIFQKHYIYVYKYKYMNIYLSCPAELIGRGILERQIGAGTCEDRPAHLYILNLFVNYCYLF